MHRIQDLAPRDATGRLQQDLLLVRQWVVGRHQQALERWSWSFLMKDAVTPISTLATVANYSHAADFWRPWFYRNATNFSWITKKAPEWIDRVDPGRTTTGAPRVWTFWGNQVQFWPTPDGVYSIPYRYISRPAAPVLAGDLIAFVSGEFLIFGALADAFVYLGGLLNRASMLQEAQGFEQKAEQLLQSQISIDRTLVIFPNAPDEAEGDAGPWLSADDLRKHDFNPVGI